MKKFKVSKVTDNKEVLSMLKSEDYDFLKTNHYLNDNILLLSLGGSRAYGTNLPESDWDVRGFAINPSNQIYGLIKDFEQIVETNTDTTIYSLNKMVRLLTECNPNTMEILGCRLEDYLYVTDLGQKVLDNKENFLSVRAIDTFGGYARAQYNRFEHALLGNGKNDSMKLDMLKHSLDCCINAFNAKHMYSKTKLSVRIRSKEEYIEYIEDLYKKKEKDLSLKLSEDIQVAIKTFTEEQSRASKIQSLVDIYNNKSYQLHEEYLDKLEDYYNAIDEVIVINGNFNDYPVGDIQSLLREINKIKSEYGNVNKRNTKKDMIHLSKHMMHLVRLYKMGTLLNNSLEIRTYWDGIDHDMLMEIRTGKYLTEDGLRVRPEFFEFLHEIQDEYEYSVKYTLLPEKPNIEALNQMLFEIYSEAYK